MGRLSEEKRHLDLLQAFKRVTQLYPASRLLIVGEGYMRETLERRTTELHLSEKVIFAGFQTDVFKYLRTMDLFVLPSRTEGFGIVLLEAMAAGLPVVATKVGGIPEIVVDNDTGLLVEPGSWQDLSEAMLKLLSDPSALRTMGHKGQERVMTHFSESKFVTAHEDFYDMCLARKGMNKPVESFSQATTR